MKSTRRRNDKENRDVGVIHMQLQIPKPKQQPKSKSPKLADRVKRMLQLNTMKEAPSARVKMLDLYPPLQPTSSARRNGQVNKARADKSKKALVNPAIKGKTNGKQRLSRAPTPLPSSNVSITSSSLKLPNTHPASTASLVSQLNLPSSFSTPAMIDYVKKLLEERILLEQHNDLHYHYSVTRPKASPQPIQNSYPLHVLSSLPSPTLASEASDFTNIAEMSNPVASVGNNVSSRRSALKRSSKVSSSQPPPPKTTRPIPSPPHPPSNYAVHAPSFPNIFSHDSNVQSSHSPPIAQTNPAAPVATVPATTDQSLLTTTILSNLTLLLQQINTKMESALVSKTFNEHSPEAPPPNPASQMQQSATSASAGSVSVQAIQEVLQVLLQRKQLEKHQIGMKPSHSSKLQSSQKSSVFPLESFVDSPHLPLVNSLLYALEVGDDRNVDTEWQNLVQAENERVEREKIEQQRLREQQAREAEIRRLEEKRKADLLQFEEERQNMMETLSKVTADLRSEYEQKWHEIELKFEVNEKRLQERLREEEEAQLKSILEREAAMKEEVERHKREMEAMQEKEYEAKRLQWRKEFEEYERRREELKIKEQMEETLQHELVMERERRERREKEEKEQKLKEENEREEKRLAEEEERRIKLDRESRRKALELLEAEERAKLKESELASLKAAQVQSANILNALQDEIIRLRHPQPPPPIASHLTHLKSKSKRPRKPPTKFQKPVVSLANALVSDDDVQLSEGEIDFRHWPMPSATNVGSAHMVTLSSESEGEIMLGKRLMPRNEEILDNNISRSSISLDESQSEAESSSASEISDSSTLTSLSASLTSPLVDDDDGDESGNSSSTIVTPSSSCITSPRSSTSRQSHSP